MKSQWTQDGWSTNRLSKIACVLGTWKSRNVSRDKRHVCIKRDPFERNVLSDQRLMTAGGALAAPSAAFIYNWNMLPIGK